ncbi:KEOPS complex subunit Pcc1, partial [Methanobacterium aggregans]
EEAENAFKSLQPDNIGFIDSHVVKNSFICDLKSSSIGTLLATADDLLFCEMMVERMAEFAWVKPPSKSK